MDRSPPLNMPKVIIHFYDFGLVVDNQSFNQCGTGVISVETSSLADDQLFVKFTFSFEEPTFK